MIWKDEDGFLDLFKDEEKFGIFNDMGTGKTALLLGLCDYKFFRGVKRILIITPKQVSLATWQNEIAKWENFHYMKNYVTLLGDDIDKRIKVLKNTPEFCIHIISSSKVPWLHGEYTLVKKKKVFTPNPHTFIYDMIIVDECSQFKEPTTERFKALDAIAQKQLFLLSGTPFSNIKEDKDANENVIAYTKADELYYMFYFLDLYKKTVYQFREAFCYVRQWEPYSYRMKPQIYDALISSLTTKSISKTLQLKIKVNYHKVYCDVDKESMKTLIKDYYVKTDAFTKIRASNKAVMINKALQLANGFLYDKKNVSVRINHYKINKLKEVLSVLNDNVIIFYSFKEDKEALLKALPNAVDYNGEETRKLWDEKKIEILLLSPFSEKYGLNFQAGGHTIIWYGLMWSGENYIQSNSRLIRRDQEFDVDVIFLLANNSFDDYVYDTLISKKTVVSDFKQTLEDVQNRL